MDKVYQSPYNEYIYGGYDHGNNISTSIVSIIYYLKTCYYAGEIDKFIRYINDNLPDVKFY
jgi:hypothetical protein